MSLNDLISMAIRNLWKRKLRTFLTVLGVIIGTASIVTMISIGIGINKSYEKQVSEWGSLQVVTVTKQGSGGYGMFFEDATSPKKNKKEVPLDLNAIEKFKEIEGVVTATPVVRGNFTIVAGRYISDFVDFIGIEPSTFDDMGYKIKEGKGIEENDRNVIVIGESALENFYNPRLSWQVRYNSEPPKIDVFNTKIQVTYDYEYGTKYADKSIKPIKVEVAGILSGGGDEAYSVIMPIKQVEKLISERDKKSKKSGTSSKSNNKSKSYDSALVRVKDIQTVKDVQQKIKDMGFNASSLSDILDSMKETTKMLGIMLGSVGAISLIVAAIGITNTMIMSIYERTREIGVMKVIGASLKDIKKLFLTEAAIIGFMGGLLGITISFIASKAINYFAKLQGGEFISLIPLELYVSSLLFATFIGIASGYLPAKRAMRLSALTAIKTE